jgi:hypothetical protein
LPNNRADGVTIESTWLKDVWVTKKVNNGKRKKTIVAVDTKLSSGVKERQEARCRGERGRINAQTTKGGRGLPFILMFLF